MKRVYVNEKWCIGCHLCEYNCAFANSGVTSPDPIYGMVKALKNVKIRPRITVEGDNKISFAVSCRHCEEPYCVKACIAGALSIVDGVITSDPEKCVGCHTCILSCPYGCIMPAPENKEGKSVIQKCELCTNNAHGKPACVDGCPNLAIVFEDRDEDGLTTGGAK